MKVSVICIADRPERLPLLYWSLVAQTHKDWELTVLWQGGTASIWLPPINERRTRVIVVDMLGDWGQTQKERAANQVPGDAFMFPNDDAYYVPIALESMVASLELGADVCVCAWLYDVVGYQAMPAMVAEGHIDVGGFMVRREAFLKVGWPNKGQTGDYQLVKALAESGAVFAMNPRILYVKN